MSIDKLSEIFFLNNIKEQISYLECGEGVSYNLTHLNQDIKERIEHLEVKEDSSKFINSAVDQFCKEVNKRKEDSKVCDCLIPTTTLEMKHWCTLCNKGVKEDSKQCGEVEGYVAYLMAGCIYKQEVSDEEMKSKVLEITKHLHSMYSLNDNSLKAMGYGFGVFVNWLRDKDK